MRYVNPGYAEWIPLISGTFGNISDTNKAKTGTAFYATYSYIPMNYPSSGEIYCRADFYYNSSNAVFIYIGERKFSNYDNYNALNLNIQSGKIQFNGFVKGNYIGNILPRVNDTEYGLKRNAINSVLFHMKWTDNENGFIEIKINDYDFGKYENADFLPSDNSKIFFTINNNGSSNIPISNIIISDEQISIKEQVIALQMNSIQSDMSFDSDTSIYTATAANQSILSSVNVNSLIEDFGSDSKVTGVTMIGNPAYKTAEGLSVLKAITKKNNTVTEHGAANLSADTNSIAQCSFTLSSDTTIADLANMQLGWKVGE